MLENKKTTTLALDPGTREMGYASFDNSDLTDWGVKSIRNDAGSRELFIHLEQILNRMFREKQPDLLVLEKNNFSQIRQNVLLTLAAHKIKAVAKRHKVRVHEFNPRTVRKLVAKNGNATKKQLARVVAVLHPELKPYLESNRRWKEQYYQNIFDAVACGLAYLDTAKRA